MFDFSWSEIVLTGLVAVVVLGPKELPQAMRTLGKFTRQARKLAGEFQGHVDDLVREVELDDIKRSIDKVSTISVGAEINKLFDPTGELGPEFEASIAKAQQDMKIAPPQVPASPEVLAAPEVLASQAAPYVPEPTEVPHVTAPPPAPHAPEPAEVKAPPTEGPL